MKKLLILIFISFFIVSCGKNDETEKTSSGNILEIENIQDESKSEEILSENQEVITEKSYFYTNFDDTEPRKAYIIKGDKVTINPKKSTETMFFASFTNASGKTTEGYLKKETISQNTKNISKNSEKEEKTEKEEVKNPICKKTYDFAVGQYNQVDYYRSFEFHLQGDCKDQKNHIKINEMGGEGFTIQIGQKSRILNFLMQMDTGFPGGCYVEKPTFSKTISKNNLKIEIKAGAEYCTFEENYTGNYRIDISIIENKIPIVMIDFDEIPKNQLENAYNSLLWTFENGFFEKNTNTSQKDVDKANKEAEEKSRKIQEDAENEKIQKLMSINGNDKLKSKAIFDSLGKTIKVYYSDDNYYTIRTGFDGKNDYEFCSKTGQLYAYCSIDEVKNGYIYWHSHQERSENYQISENDYFYSYESDTEYYRTDIKKSKTEFLRTDKRERTCSTELKGEIPCEN